MVSDSSFISKLLPTVSKAHPVVNNSAQTEEIWYFLNKYNNYY